MFVSFVVLHECKMMSLGTSVRVEDDASNGLILSTCLCLTGFSTFSVSGSNIISTTLRTIRS